MPLSVQDYFARKNLITDRDSGYLSLLNPQTLIEYAQARKHESLEQTLLDITAHQHHTQLKLLYVSLYNQFNDLQHYQLLPSAHGTTKILSDHDFFIQELEVLSLLLRQRRLAQATYILPQLRELSELESLRDLFHRSKFVQSHQLRIGFSIENFATIMLADRFLNLADAILLRQSKLAQIIYSHHDHTQYHNDRVLSEIESSLQSLSHQHRKPLYIVSNV